MFAGLSSGKKFFLVTVGRTIATCTPDSWAARLIEAAGLKNAAYDAKPISPESVVASFGAENLLERGEEIDVILLQQGSMNALTADEFMRDARFSSLRAVRGKMVFDVPESDISRPSLSRLEDRTIESLRKLAD
jgi:iron complex transport system substrate-binding protein